MGVLSIMYHRFNEFEYPSTNISMDIFKKHVELIFDANLSFYHPKKFEKEFNLPKKEKKILLTIDDAFKSFYDNAWPYLKKNKIPFILFVSTEPIGKSGYMSWSEIKEIEKYDFAVIGHHSHSHEYLIDKTNKEFIKDIEKANKIFLQNLSYIPTIFSYPFGEYSKLMRDYISKNFKLSFGQHSGVIDVNKEKLVSIDFNHHKASAIIDASLTNVVGNNMGKISAWYDNEWGFSNRMCDIAEYLHKKS